MALQAIGRVCNGGHKGKPEGHCFKGMFYFFAFSERFLFSLGEWALVWRLDVMEAVRRGQGMDAGLQDGYGGAAGDLGSWLSRKRREGVKIGLCASTW